MTTEPMHRSATFPGDPGVAGLLAEYGEVLEREAALRREVEELREELARARVVADDARQVKAAFVAHMSHEVRTPLNAIVGLLEQMLAGPLADEQRELAGHVRASGEHLAQTLGGILEMAQLEQNAVALAQQRFELVEEVELALAAVAPFAAARGVELCLTAGEAAYVTAVGDAGRLRQVLVNVVGNAVRFGGSGDVEVDVEVERAGQEVVAAVEVRDHGPGVDPEVLPRLFSGTGALGVGLGYGLPICARVCALMGGEIAVENHREGGAVVRFRVRLGFAGQATPEAAQLAGRRVQVETASAGLRAMLGRWLAQWGAQVVDDGGELVIADEGRPVCTSGVPVVVLVAVGSQMRPAAAVAACVARPVAYERLAAAVRVACAARPSRGTTSATAADSRAAAPEGAAASTAPTGDAPRLRILVAEDNPFNQRVILGALRRLGYAADVVMDGRAAIEAVANKPYDLVLMDVMMPELDGVAATREICARWPIQQRPRIVAITAQATADDHTVCLAAGMADFLTKPLETSRLAAVLQACPRREE